MPTKVQHIVRFSIQDYMTCRVRARSAMKADPNMRLVYLEILFRLYEGGGAISADPEVLADTLMLPAEEVARCLPELLAIGRSGRGGLYLDDAGLLRNKRVDDEIEDERRYRAGQSEAGRRGGRRSPSAPQEEPDECKGYPKATQEVPQARLLGDEGDPKLARAPAPPPSPPPPPTPLPTPIPAPEEGESRAGTREGPAGSAEPGASPRAPAKRAGSTGFDPRDVPLPPILDTAEFRAAWLRRIEERARPGLKAKERYRDAERVAGKLERLARVAAVNGVEAAVECVERAAVEGYQGEVFTEDLLEVRRGNGNGGRGRDALRPMGAHPELDDRAELCDRAMFAATEEERLAAGAEYGRRWPHLVPGASS